ncbi:hypothetical protein MANES_08G107400v8 [Manihot esculenta]|uniref:Uncharacterized protein n=1 Tax=Manihot esculenta TaxID=3983 RepID=A0A2C9VF94_MANES|nr:hypothetical protein MANES_08G107400v8 [Manihot esculenta]
MGGNSRQTKKSISFSAFNIFKSRRPRRVDDCYEDVSSARRVYPSDEDGRGPWSVADPRIDIKTSAFIAHFHATRISESDRQIYQPAKAS